ncbi:MAG: tRNA uridine-5-carboxymethylaminomethyl(34) synthesis GTPase MnmE [Methylibium sp.]|uniref:tRNA uridine-5-carboxymethylaminomethyl(34) synthesis GTPase MnmE n=1 Tax=Methylibium sp. TaxID=2067992 RepID=UPI001797BF8F|nr:tRNA uridine-5-carboxymethylaminomethyl(34) synthesis GTPase MnmE [Methylibium sp.]MBA3595771.1 tRNA uridine-5-carboxymethylaminomethyl(34) synthesis GTPase MnmE [Methylibium sp.]
MLARLHDPVAAIATAPGRGAVGIVRVSGRDLGGLIRAVCGQALVPRHAHYLSFIDGQGGVIDQGLALHFPAPHSYTGEEVLELQAHGGPVLLQLLLARCLQALPGSRVAEPGEFTQRAFLNDKLDLAQAEAVADLIDASTEAAARSASRALAGAFSHEIDGLRDRLIELRMLVEATLDFPEEEIDFLQQADARGRLARIAAALDAVLMRARQGALLREGLSVVLAGQPNVGKSSLLNALAGAELAIVTPIPGTTRDKVSETIQIEGVPLHVIDTAGLRTDGEASDEVERLGIERSWGAIGSADVVIFLHDLTRGDDAAYRAGEQEIAGRLPAGVSVLDVYNKIDAVDAQVLPANALALSARTGDGLEALRQRLLQLAGWQAGAEGVFIARARHLEALHATRAHVEQAQALAARDDAALDLLAEELRCAHDALGAITGRFTADDLLGEIFGRFCIGK